MPNEPVFPFFFPKPADDAAPETITLALPEQLEDFLYVMVVLNSYRGWIMSLGRKALYNIHCRPEWVPLVKVVMSGSTTPTGRKSDATREDVRYVTTLDADARSADLVLELDHHAAYEISRHNRRHAVESYGIIIGSGPDGRVPILGRSLAPELPLLLYLPRHVTDFSPETQWPLMNDFVKMVSAVLPLQARILSGKASLPFAYDAISRAAVCVGVCGGLTTLAASLGRPVVEIYPNNLFHENWAAKFGNRGQPSASAYSVIRDNPAKVSLNSVMGTLGRMMASLVKGNPPWLAQLTQSKETDASTSTEPLTSSAGIADAPS